MAGSHIDNGVSATREEELAIIGDVQAHHSFLVSLDGKKKLVSVEGPCLSCVSQVRPWGSHVAAERLGRPVLY